MVHHQIVKQIKNLILEHFQEDLEKAGVSAIFVANYIEANADYIILDAIQAASEIGEVHCIKCDEYFTRHNIAEFKTDKPDYASGICKECAINDIIKTIQ